MNDATSLAHYFVHHITQSTVGVEKRIEQAKQAIESLVKEGWFIEEIKEVFDQFSKEYPRVVLNVYHVGEIMQNKTMPSNLLSAEEFYYHNALREISPPTRLVQDPVTGQFIRKSTPFYLEMKKRFTMNDLLRYWYDQMGIQATEHLLRQDEGKFTYLLQNYTVDELLFCIDRAKYLRKERNLRPLRSAFDLEKYIEDARDFMKEKENVHKLAGIHRVIKRHDGTDIQ